MNCRALKAKLVLNSISMGELAAMLGISRSALFRKLNGRSEFTQSEISQIAKILHLDAEEISLIFFDEEVS